MKKYSFLIILFLILSFLVNFIFYVKEHFNTRSETSLINQYFKLRDTHPADAKRTLERLLEKEPTHKVAMQELGYWYIRQGNTHEALKQFLLTYHVYPNDQRIVLELGKLYASTSQYAEAHTFLSKAAEFNDDLNLKQQAKIILSQLPVTTKSYPVKDNSLINANAIPATTPAIPAKTGVQTTISVISEKAGIQNKKIGNNKLFSKLAAVESGKKPTERDTLLNQYYALKKTHPQQAWLLLKKIINKYPNDVDALKEAGYTTLNAKDKAQAYVYFKRAYDITNDPQLAMQLGYILVDLNKNRLAYRYFNLATHTNDAQRIVDAERAKTNLAPSEIKMLPEPYYADIFYDPFYYSRFKMMVQPFSIKIGKMLEEKHQLKVYLSYQRITDNRSNFSQQLPQIFEDNASVTAVGTRLNPFPTIPLTAFLEIGKAVDLVYQDRSRWRSDLRAGLAYYKDWGEKPDYTLKPVLSGKTLGDLYADMIYFTRYQNTIGSVRLREGFRIFKYQTSSIDIYLKGFLVWDTAHQYYNNIFEWGPGIAITPSNRFNVVFHLEALQGHYLPVNSPSPNPYSSNYHNNLLLLNCYFRL